MTGPFESTDQFTVLDRSTLEAYATCPAQARFVDSGQCKTVGAVAVVGNLVHETLAYAMAWYVEAQGMVSRSDLSEEVLLNLRQSRPDLQPDVLRAFKCSVWAWSDYLTNIHFNNLLRYEGGKGRRSGQLAWNLDSLQLRITSELDLLHATASPQVLDEIDYKTGHKYWTAEAVRDSFQFQLHAWLVMQNYPDVDCLRISVWNTRTNRRSYPTEFHRRNLGEFGTRFQTAAGDWYKYHNDDPESAPTWPSLEKCSICPAAVVCPESDKPARELAESPEQFVESMVAVDARLAAMKKLASAYVEVNGDIVCDNGTAFGENSSTNSRKPSKKIYKLEKNHG